MIERMTQRITESVLINKSSQPRTYSLNNTTGCSPCIGEKVFLPLPRPPDNELGDEKRSAPILRARLGAATICAVVSRLVYEKTCWCFGQEIRKEVFGGY
jgi:hypothetical protein